MEGCFFCDQQTRRIPVVGDAVYTDEWVYASHMFNQTEPTYLGYLAVQTRRHVHFWADLTEMEASALGLAILRLSRAFKACLGAAHTYVVYYAEVVPHFHALLTARYPETPKEYWRAKVYDWPGAPKGDADAVAKLCDYLRSDLSGAK